MPFRQSKNTVGNLNVSSCICFTHSAGNTSLSNNRSGFFLFCCPSFFDKNWLWMNRGWLGKLKVPLAFRLQQYSNYAFKNCLSYVFRSNTSFGELLIVVTPGLNETKQIKIYDRQLFQASLTSKGRLHTEKHCCFKELFFLQKNLSQELNSCNLRKSAINRLSMSDDMSW